MRFPLFPLLARVLRRPFWAGWGIMWLTVPLPALVETPTSREWSLAEEFVFLQDEVTRVDVTIDPADFQSLLEDPFTDELKRTTVRWRNSRIDLVFEDVGFRVRGNFSRAVERKSWKLDFNAFVPGRDLFGLEKVNLNGDHHDPTLLRSMAAWRLARRMGLAASRAHLVALTINGEFWSIQVHVEHIDEEFTDNWFGSKDGDLYKCLYLDFPADLEIVEGEDYAHYGGEMGLTYEKKSPDTTDTSRLAALIRFINTASDQEILEQLPLHLDVDGWLRYEAFNVATGNWDDYWMRGNNYYLYWNTLTGRFEWIPYDFNTTFGMNWLQGEGTDWSTRHFEGWGDLEQGFPTPLAERIFAQEAWKTQYHRYLREALDLVSDPAVDHWIDAWTELIRPYYDGRIEGGGPHASLYDAAQLDEPDVFQPGGIGHSMGLRPFLAVRRDSLRAQLAELVPAPSTATIRINEILTANESTQPTDEAGDFEDWIELVNVSQTEVDLAGWFLSDDPAATGKWAFAQGTVVAPGSYLVVWADDERLEGPLHAGFRLAREGETLVLSRPAAEGFIVEDWVAVPPLPADTSFGRHPDGSGRGVILSRPTPGEPNADPAVPSAETPPRLRLNEFLAENGSGIRDPSGEAEDWVEIYNAGPEEADLGGMYLTDRLTDPFRWQFPPGTVLESGGFLLVWTDGEVFEPGLHASFSLNREGEQIGLIDIDSRGNRLLDSLSFGPQSPDISLGRWADGAPEWVRFGVPTPGFSNGSMGTGWLAQ